VTAVGYIRVSSEQQTHDAQRDALTALGVERIFADKASGGRQDRPGYLDLLAYVRPGDVIVVTSLDRFGRSLSGIVNTVADLATRQVHIRTIRESIDTSTDVGRLLMGIFGSLAEYERTLIRERASVARAAARARGKHVGRPRAMTREQELDALALRQAGRSAADIVRNLGVSRSTLYRLLAAHPDPVQ